MLLKVLLQEFLDFSVGFVLLHPLDQVLLMAIGSHVSLDRAQDVLDLLWAAAAKQHLAFGCDRNRERLVREVINTFLQ